jgi:hypothetical protein
MARVEQEIFKDLAELCVSSGYVHVVAHFCFRDSTVRFLGDLKPEDMDHLFSMSRLIRTEISTLIGLMAKKPIDYALPPPNEFRRLATKTEELLEEIHEAMTLSWRDGLRPEKQTPSDVKSFWQGESLREPIFYGGESAYSFQYRDFAVLKYAKDDEWLRANRGFTIRTVTRIAKAISEIQNEKQIATGESVKALPPKQRTMLPAFLLSPGEIAIRTGHELGTVKAVLNAFSLTPGEANANFDSLHEFNAANSTPFVKKDDEFILFLHYGLMEAIYESPFYWFTADRSYAAIALGHRGNFAEKVAYDRLVAVFGTEHVFANATIEKKKSERRGEIDVLAVYGDTAIILQAKSKRLTIEARKGNDLQIKDDFKKAVQEAYDQAFDCASALLEPNCNLTDSRGNRIEIATPLKRIHLICIVADHYPALAFQARQFLRYQKTNTIAPPLVTDVFAIDTITEFLHSPLYFLSYISLRAEFGEKVISTHELTLLSYHLKRNLWFSDEHDFVWLGDDIGAELDVAMLVRREGFPGKSTPRGILTNLRDTAVGRLITELEARPQPVTIDLGLLLLKLGEDTVGTLNEAIEDYKRFPGKASESRDITIAFGGASSGLTIHCNDRADEDAANHLAVHCEARKYSQKANSWFGIAIRPIDGSIRFCVKLERAWAQDDEMDRVLTKFGQSRTLNEVRARFEARRKVGRNASCPCGSGLKYKKCCLR